MAEEKSNLEFRDLNAQDDEPYLTRPTSLVDLDRRLEEGAVPDSDLSGRYIVNPNPFGEEDYAGTDPIYQNHANDTEAPHAAEEGPEKEAEDAVRDLYEPKDDAVVVDDFGTGGEAVKAGQPNVDREVYLVPGQEGYPDDPSKLSGPVVSKSAVTPPEETKGDDAKEKQPETQPPASPAAPVVQNQQ